MEHVALKEWSTSIRRPLTLLVLRVFRLDHKVSIPVLPAYTGCLSWIQISQEIDVSRRTAVIDDRSFAREREGILNALSTFAG